MRGGDNRETAMVRTKEKKKRNIATNRRARHFFHVIETLEAGIILTGSEVKSLRNGSVSLGDSYAVERGGGIFLLNCHISQYEMAKIQNHEPLRPRKLLLHKREIKKLVGKIARKGYTLVPLSIYFHGDYAKVKLALCRGKPRGDRRQETQAREAEREIGREMARRSRNR